MSDTVNITSEPTIMIHSSGWLHRKSRWCESEHCRPATEDEITHGVVEDDPEEFMRRKRS